MTNIGLSEAARLTGKPRSTLHRAMKMGRLSYTVGADGARLIDPAELERIYVVRPNATPAPDASPVAWNKSQQSEMVAQLAAERAKTAMLEARFADAREQISDLRARLDASEAERRGEAEERRRLTALLTDQREKAATPTSTWGRFLAWRRGGHWSRKPADRLPVFPQCK